VTAAALVSAVAVLVAAFIKGAIGFGFPTLATPLLAMVIDVKAAVAVLIFPNLVMDAYQPVRRAGLGRSARRLAMLLAGGVVGTILGTRLLVLLPPRYAVLILGVFVLAFVGLNSTPFSPRVAPGWERWLSPPIGLLAGVVGGLTNVPGTPLVIYFYALGMDKSEFVRSVAFSFVVYKTTQLATVMYFGLLPSSLFFWSLAIAALALATFWLGLRVQARLDQAAFNRAVLAFLALLGAGLVARGIA
jgi:uncharacterized protein